MDGEQVVIKYRGYLLIQRVYRGTATDRILRPNGTWRYSPPTQVYGEWRGWVVAQRAIDGAIAELAAVGGDEAARRWVDDKLQSQQ
jgi:hypothetical protein